MKTNLIVSVLVGFMFISCEKNDDSNAEIGKGFEIYQTLNAYPYNPCMDYSKLDFDTISLSDTPILRYRDIKQYDTITHKLSLEISHDFLKIGSVGVFGGMFVVTIDKKPIYCGFKWSVISSVPCNWVYIEEPYFDLDHLNDNEFVISFKSNNFADPRMERRIIDRLKADRKIK